MSHALEASYPIHFRSADVQTLGTHIKQHSSVSLIGMKRVGISNFLRFFLGHPELTQQFVNPKQHLFVMVDLNNLVEQSHYAFWMLMLKKIVDAIEADSFPEKTIAMSRTIFTQSIQLGDLFFTVEALHKVLAAIAAENKYLTLFFLRFDRFTDVMTAELFANMKGLKESSNHISYVFTSYRPLNDLIPHLSRSALAGFVHEMYLKPAVETDVLSIATAFQDQYDLKLPNRVLKQVMKVAGGHVQYFHLALIRLKNDPALVRSGNIEQALLQDEEISYLSEEIWTSLNPVEQTALLKTHEYDRYLWDTGLVIDDKKPQIFNRLFTGYVEHVSQLQRKEDHDFTRKEHLLFSILKEHEGNLVERDQIIERVWPDEVELGVSDWSIDRLVSRVRNKLLAQKSKYKIMTVITRGYKLIKATDDQRDVS